MGKSTFLFLIIFCAAAVLGAAQNSTEIYLFDLSKNGQEFELSNPINISDNPGYDNQPHFLPDGSGILFSSTRNGQTDVVQYNLSNGKKTWLTDSEGSEYSPTILPDGQHFSTIILEEDGTQQLWKYPISGGKAEVLVSDIVIGYHAWYDENTLYSFVLGDPATLQKSDLETGKHTIIAENPGRSLHKIPSSGNISFVDKSDSSRWVIKSLNPKNGEITSLVETLPNSEDLAWTPSGHIFMGNGSKLYSSYSENDAGWTEAADLSNYGLKGVTRLAIGPDGNKIAVVVEQ